MDRHTSIASRSDSLGQWLPITAQHTTALLVRFTHPAGVISFRPRKKNNQSETGRIGLPSENPPLGIHKSITPRVYQYDERSHRTELATYYLPKLSSHRPIGCSPVPFCLVLVDA